MFTVDKTTLPRYWWAYAGHVKEKIGENCNNDSDFSCEEDAIAYAEHQLQERLDSDYACANRYSRLVLTIYAIRALWNSQIKEGLARYNKLLAEAQEAKLNPPAVKISYAPNQIPVTGNKLEIGTKVYVVDTESLTFQENIVVGEHISYYDHRPEGTVAYYALDNKLSVDSTMKSSYSNRELFLDKTVAEYRITTLVQKRINELQNQLRNM